jgi:hypothetical protein
MLWSNFWKDYHYFEPKHRFFLHTLHTDKEENCKFQLEALINRLIRAFVPGCRDGWGGSAEFGRCAGKARELSSFVPPTCSTASGSCKKLFAVTYSVISYRRHKCFWGVGEEWFIWRLSLTLLNTYQEQALFCSWAKLYSTVFRKMEFFAVLTL